MENRRCCLRHTYLAVKTQADKSFGGNQNWATGYMMRKYGCGGVALGDVLIYLGIHRLPCNTDLLYGMLREDGCLSYPRYERYLRKMNKRYLGIIPGFGVPNFQLARAMNRYFRHYRIDLRARWCLSSGKMLERIQDSLSKDYPVILAIGQNIPFWRKKKLTLYRQENGVYLPATETKAHYVVVTGMENGYLQISSWGKEYFISWKEYQEYGKKYSSFWASNICLIQEKKGKKHE